MKKVSVHKAVGLVLSHDITRIVPGQFKGVGFKKGHVIRPEDIPALLDLGKESVFVLEIQPGILHENDAAYRLANALIGENLALQGPAEGKINFVAQIKGLLKIKVTALNQVNLVPRIIVSTLHNHSVVQPGNPVAGTRIIPLTIAEKAILRAESICARFRPIITLKPFISKKVGVVVTGSEVYTGRVQDGFDHWVGEKLAASGCQIIKRATVPDKAGLISQAIREMVETGCDLIVTTGGMSH